MPYAKTIEEYVESAPDRAAELRRLREILLSTGLEETIKWGAPCYVHAGRNVVSLGAFKSYVGLWFFQGALLEDPEGVLVNAQRGKTKAMRQWRFESDRDIRVRPIKAYVREAMGLAEQGREVPPDRDRPIDVPAELEATLAEDQATRKAFDALTPGKRREYADHVAEAKREATRQRRVEKIMPMIRAGVGLHDQYRGG